MVTDWALAAAPILDTQGQLRAGVPTDTLLTALRLVRGVPLADVAAPWADSPRLTMVLLLRDVAVELLSRASDLHAVRMEIQSLSARLLPSDRVDRGGYAA